MRLIGLEKINLEVHECCVKENMTGAQREEPIVGQSANLVESAEL